MADEKDVNDLLDKQGISPDSLPESERQALREEMDDQP